MKLMPWLVILFLSVSACSGSKSAKKVNEETPQIELSDADEFIENPSEEVVAATEEPVVESAEPMEEPVVTETAEEPVEITNETVAAVAVSAPSATSGSTMQYTVKKNETLMLISFKLYGDYEKWKSIANQNRDKLKGSTQLSEGMVLDYISPAQEFVWNPEGLPYLIRTGDTLGIISKSVYSTTKKWKLIWDNNRPLIKDPNRIFAGFTLYYLENGREVASGI